MPTVDQQLVGRKLKTLKAKVSEFREAGPSSASTIQFKNWVSDIYRWLGIGREYTNAQKARLLSVRFQVEGGVFFSEWDPESNVIDTFETGLGETENILEQAIENLDLGIQEGAEAVDESRNAAPLINITNSNVINLSMQQVLEDLAAEIEKKDPGEGKSFRETLKRWSESPILQAVLKTAGQIILRRYADGGTISV
jgi:hypothetical protein